MKRVRIILLVLSFLLVSLVGIVSNALAANLSAVPPIRLWVVGIGIIIVFVAVNVILAVLDAKQKEDASIPSPLRHAKQKKLHARPLQDIQQLPSQTVVSPHPPIHTASEEGQPTVEEPMLLCLAIDVSDSMKKPIIDHIGKAIERWTSIHNALEHFIQLGVAWVKDPETQRVLPLYHLLAYGFGFKETMYGLGVRKKPGGSVRDLLAHPSLTPLPSASVLSEHWADYKNHLLSMKTYTGDLSGSTPMCQALRTIRDRMKEECARKSFTFPLLLLIISDGLPDDGDPLPLIQELHAMGVMTLCCFLADRDILAPRHLFDKEEVSWSPGAKLLFRCASTLHNDTYVSRAMFDYLADYGWQPREGVRLFAQVNQAEALGNFLEVLLRGSATERRA